MNKKTYINFKPVISKKNETFIVFAIGILFDLATTIIGLTLYEHVQEANGNPFILIMIGLMQILIISFFIKQLDNNKYVKWGIRSVGYFRYVVGLWNTIMILVVL